MNAGDAAIFPAGDVTNKQDVTHFVSHTIEHFGKIDILGNNAGGSSGFAPVAELTDESWQAAAAWILHSAFSALGPALKDMQARGYGRIINISSIEVRLANNTSISHYIAFKHALNGFTKAVAFEYGAQGITCNAISPGAVETDLMRDAGRAAAESMGITCAQEAAMASPLRPNQWCLTSPAEGEGEEAQARAKPLREEKQWPGY